MKWSSQSPNHNNIITNMLCQNDFSSHALNICQIGAGKGRLGAPKPKCKSNILLCPNNGIINLLHKISILEQQRPATNRASANTQQTFLPQHLAPKQHQFTSNDCNACFLPLSTILLLEIANKSQTLSN